MMTLAELVLKWQDGSLTEDELRELNGLLQDAEARTLLAREFALSAGLVEALESERARRAAREQVHAFGTRDLQAPLQLAGDLAEGSSPPGRRGRWPWPLRRALAMVRWGWKPGWALSAAVVASVLALAAGALMLFPDDALARVELAPSGFTIQRGSRVFTPAEAGFRLEPGDVLGVPEAQVASFVYAREKTRIQMQGGTVLTLQANDEGKRLELARGSIFADVATQLEGQAMVLMTPHATATVLGTELSLTVSSNASRLEVLSGTVRLARREDERAIMVAAGGYATAGSGIELAARPLLQAPWHSQDIGLTARPGSARFESDGKQCRVHSHASERRRGRDDFHFVYQTLDGDGEIRARVLEFDGRDPRTKAGVVIRGSLKSDALTASLRVNAGRGLEFKRRGGNETRTDIVGQGSFPYWVRLVRHGNTITAYKSPDGQAWTPTGSGRFEMGRRIYVGLGVTSADKSAGSALFDNVSVISTVRTPAPLEL